MSVKGSTWSNVRELVPVEPIAAAVLQEIADRELSLSEVALWLGWVNSSTGSGDTSRVCRRLGLIPARPNEPPQRFITRRMAAEFCRVLNIWPCDVGL